MNYKFLLNVLKYVILGCVLFASIKLLIGSKLEHLDILTITLIIVSMCILFENLISIYTSKEDKQPIISSCSQCNIPQLENMENVQNTKPEQKIIPKQEQQIIPKQEQQTISKQEQ